MKSVGIGEALIGNIFLDGQAAGPIKVLSEDWWKLVEHAIREGGRIGVNIGMFNCPGWSQSGGPWIKPGQSMRHVIFSEIRVTGPKQFSEKLTAPVEHFQDISVLAFPAPQSDGEAPTSRSPRLSSTPAVEGLEKLADGKTDTVARLVNGAAGGKKSFTVDIEMDAPLTARSLQVTPGNEAFGADCELQSADDTGNLQPVRKFRCDRSNMAVNVGPSPRGPVTISFPAVTSRHFRLVFSNFFARGKNVELAEISLSGAARLESYIEKQLGKMHPTPLPLWDTYMWPTQPEPDAGKLSVPAADVRDLSAKMTDDGTLKWEIPAGE